MEIILLFLLVLLYFLPTAIAYNRKNVTGIFLLNFFLGWTFLGWVGALIWAVCSEKKAEQQRLTV